MNLQLIIATSDLLRIKESLESDQKALHAELQRGKEPSTSAHFAD